MKIDPLKLVDEAEKGKRRRRRDEDTEAQKAEDRKKQWKEPDGFFQGARVTRK